MKLRMTNLNLEWEIKDESKATVISWPPQRRVLCQHTSTTLRHWRLILFTIFLALLAGSIGVVHLVDRAERTLKETEYEIELAVEADSWLRDPSGVKSHIQAIELQNNLAIVQMSVNDVISEGNPATVETTFYRQSTEGWVRIEANEAAWASYLYRETDHFLFQYHYFDHSLVATVAPAIERFHSDLVRDVGLALPPIHEKILVKIAMPAGMTRGDSSDLADYVVWNSDGIVVLSPRLLSVSVTKTDAEVLRQAIYAGVASRIIHLAVQEHQPQAVWRDVVIGLQLWAYSAHRELDVDVANEMDNRLHQQLMDAALPRLSVLSASPPMIHPEETQVTGWKQNILSKTVIDYAIATYGRGSLARLLDGIHYHDSWQRLIPEVFGVPANQFESGWQAYLAVQYDLHYPD